LDLQKAVATLSGRVERYEGETAAINDHLWQLWGEASEGEDKATPVQGVAWERVEQLVSKVEAQLSEVERRLGVQETSMGAMDSVVKTMFKVFNILLENQSRTGIDERPPDEQAGPPERGRQEAEFPTLLKNGEQPSAGADRHPDKCRPCFFFCFSKSGCSKGPDCAYCHRLHLSKKTRRLLKASMGETPPSTAASSSSAPSVAATQSSHAEHPSLERDGPQPSEGSALHPNGCRPCIFYCFSRSGCRTGRNCEHCHMEHAAQGVSRPKQRRAEGS